MESEILFFMLLAVLLLGVGVIGGILGCVALASAASLRKEFARLRGEVDLLRLRVREFQTQAIPPPMAPVASSVAERPQAASEVPAAPPQSRPIAPSLGTRPPLTTATAAPAEAAPKPGPVPPLPPPPPPGAGSQSGLSQLESKIGQRWIAWVGAIVVFFSAVFFLKHAFDNDWIGPTGQVVICALVAGAMVTCGSYFVQRRWRILGQSVMGLGLAILYATFYAAFAVYVPPVMSQPTAFAFLVAVTVAGMALAVMHDAVSLAFLAVLGGVLTPVLVSTGQDSRDALFTYLLLLNLGVMGVAFFRGWRLLDTLAMVGTFILYAGWHNQFYTPAGMGPALAWLGGFYVIFLVLPFLYHLVRRREITLERFLMALTNAAFAASFAWHMLRDEYLFTMGFVALGMGAAYLVLGAVIRRRLPGDARSLFGTIAMTVTFLTLAVPMQLRAQGIMLAWVAEAPVLCYLAYRFRYFPVRVFGAAILVLGVGRLFFFHWPLHEGLFVAFFNRHLLSALAVPAAAAAYALVHQFHKDQATAADRAMKLAAALGGGFLALIILHAEIHAWLRNDYSAYAAGNAVTALWATGALAYLFSGARASQGSRAAVWGVGTFVLFVAAILSAYTFDITLGPGHLLFANARFSAGLLVTAVVFGYAWVMHRTADGPASLAGAGSRAFVIVGIVGLLVLLSVEVYSFCADVVEDDILARRAGQMSITLVWSIYAAMMLVIGFWKRRRPLRFGGLALFGVAALKLVLVDLAFLRDINRIVSFLVLGMLMLAASYLYHRLEKRLAGAAGVPAPASGPPTTGEKI